MIDIRNLKKSFVHSKEQKKLLTDLSLYVQTGHWVTIVGPSGSGKTTFLNCISGLLIPDDGDILFGDINIYRLTAQQRSDYRRSHIGFIFQDFKLLPYYSILDNVMLPLLYDEPKDSLCKRAEALLHKVGIPKSYYNRLPDRLSGGEKQRVAIARALIANPKVLIGDEPTGNLDMDNRDNILKILTELKDAGLTIVMVTHDEEVASCGDEIYRLHNGNLEKREAAQ
ncbi:ABC transporter ATP-binding protein [Psychrobacillus sp. BL-248-WT-3]|uniref:ABC transporter ATP-binding protein n=1 Tax=Psychrobacillus sp. BL-248-WT-3 TaxID=2725306 RepID=UPI00146BBEB3|nr:ABC transporter ATP-binding protein [Psychrobacillus sp. BL-248-WT-3]NME06026.1 ABC transporter ATP-binding protein [Psychrobacillus sp. BL-248-WT-3]